MWFVSISWNRIISSSIFHIYVCVYIFHISPLNLSFVLWMSLCCFFHITMRAIGTEKCFTDTRLPYDWWKPKIIVVHSLFVQSTMSDWLLIELLRMRKKLRIFSPVNVVGWPLWAGKCIVFKKMCVWKSWPKDSWPDSNAHFSLLLRYTHTRLKKVFFLGNTHTHTNAHMLQRNPACRKIENQRVCVTFAYGKQKRNDSNPDAWKSLKSLTLTNNCYLNDEHFGRHLKLRYILCMCFF